MRLSLLTRGAQNCSSANRVLPPIDELPDLAVFVAKSGPGALRINRSNASSLRMPKYGRGRLTAGERFSYAFSS